VHAFLLMSAGSLGRGRVPLVPKYNGSGPTTDASSFHPVLSPNAGASTRWIGDYLFYQPVGSGQ
jgi:hypothetical protein